jgi:hypothetical protein
MEARATGGFDLNVMDAFFGRDTKNQPLGKAGSDWVVFNSEGLQYDQPLVKGRNYNQLIATPMYEFLLAQNHGDLNPSNRDHLAEDVVDFVYSVGRTHGTKAMIDTRYAGISSHHEYNEATRKFMLAMNNPNSTLKVGPSGEEYKTAFWGTLPLVPDTVRGYVDSNKAVPFPVNINSHEFLRKIYEKGYLDGVAGSIQGKNYVERLEMKGGAYLNPKGWSLDLKTFLEAARNCADRVIPPAKHVPIGDDELELYDMASGVFYGRNEKGELYRMENGKSVIVDMSKPFDGNCLGNGQNCDETIVKCLLSGNPNTLAECLNKLKDENMFNVAQNEINKVHPTVLVQLLTTFGFKPVKHTDGVVRPISFDDWEKSVLSTQVTEDVKNAILANKKLMSYLRSIVSIVRQNPTVLNCTQVARKDRSTYAVKAEIRPFVSPVFTSPRTLPMTPQGILLPQMPLALGLQNVMGRLPMMHPGLMGMIGGGTLSCVNADLLRKTFNSLFTQMERSGRVLVDEDKAKIENSIEKVARLETSLARYMDDIKLLAKLNETYSLGNPVPVRTVSLNEVRSEASERRGDAARNLASLTELSQKNINELATILGTFVTKVIPSLGSIIVGQPNQYVVAR